MKLNYEQLSTLHNLLEFINSNSYIEVPSPTLDILKGIKVKVDNEMEDLWKPLSELPPLKMKVIVKDIETGDEREMIRLEYADSYSPASMVMHHDDVPETLWTAHYKWRLP